ncbi:MAG: ABC transporter substrate-binding protein [Desulfuromonadaceae bacterium]
MHLPTSDMTVQHILTTWPQTRAVFAANGLEAFTDPAYVERVGRFMKLETALKRKGFGVEPFVAQLHQQIQAKEHQADVVEAIGNASETDIDVAGLLPCPVRVPLLDGIAECVEECKQTGLHISTRFKAASGGSEWIEEEIRAAQEVSELPDIFVSAGFDTFFDPDGIGRFQRQGAFKALEDSAVNDAFAGLELRDPKGVYSIISTVPAVFMLDTHELGDLPAPRTWAQLLEPEYAGQVALPVGDFDLFNAMLLTIHKEFGDAGVEKLGRSMLESMHPAQMGMAPAGKTRKPLVTIMPYFFTRMAKNIPGVEIIWPEDGAIISPIFMLQRKDSFERARPVAEFLGGKEVGDILARQGLFPSLNPAVENILPESAPWKWVGWDYIYAHDIAAQIKRLEEIFHRSHAEQAQQRAGASA